jgi:hypothetical protein
VSRTIRLTAPGYLDRGPQAAAMDIRRALQATTPRHRHAAQSVATKNYLAGHRSSVESFYEAFEDRAQAGAEPEELRNVLRVITQHGESIIERYAVGERRLGLPSLLDATRDEIAAEGRAATLQADVLADPTNLGKLRSFISRLREEMQATARQLTAAMQHERRLLAGDFDGRVR